MFCPNCGTKNDGVELPCKKCGFKLSGAAAPKFRGTMMLHAEQSVQEMIDEHRRKQTEQGEAEAPAAAASGSGPEGSGAAPLFGMPGAPKAAPVQPPRAGLPKRRMGTMMGVAPQVGGVQPPEGDALLPGTTPAAPEVAPSAIDVPPSALDPLGGTVAVPVLPFPTPSAGGLLAGRTEAFEAVPAQSRPPVAPPALGAPEEARQESELAAVVAPSPAPRRTEPLDSVAPPARRTEPLDSVAPPARRTEPLDSVAPPARRRRVRPLDVFLILITFGLYGFVLLARQRRKRPDVS